MAQGIIVDVTAAERDRLGAIVADRNSPQKHVWRAAIVLATADGLGTVAIIQRTGKSKTAVWRWQERFAAEVRMEGRSQRHHRRRCTRAPDVRFNLLGNCCRRGLENGNGRCRGDDPAEREPGLLEQSAKFLSGALSSATKHGHHLHIN